MQEKLHFSVRLARYVQGLMQDLTSLARKILSRLAYILQDGFYWELKLIFLNIYNCSWKLPVLKSNHK